MPNEKGWYTKEEVLETGLLYYIPSSKRWTHGPYKFAVLLSESRCNKFKVPILSSGRELPSAFRYIALVGTGTADKTHRYCPLYDRTDTFVSGELDLKELYEQEIMGNLNMEREDVS